MTVNRRSLLQIPVVLAVPAARAQAAVLAPAPEDRVDVLTAWVDTLLPAHGDSPSGSSLGIVGHLLAQGQSQPALGKLLRAGCGWLDQAARALRGKPFATLDEADREGIVSTAEGSAPRSLPRQFFFHTHRLAMPQFYAHPDAWPALHYPGPPQPVGFPGHDRPPGDPPGDMSGA